MKRKKLYLLTETFPYGQGEKSFLLPELPLLAENFDVTIITSADLKTINDKKLETPLAQDINLIKYSKGEVSGIGVIKYIVSFLVNRACRNELKEILESKKNILKRLKKSLFFYASAEKFRRWLTYNNVVDNEDAIYYSYWYTHRVLSVVLDKHRYSKLKIVTRTHGFDLYNERVESGKRQPFKSYMDRYVDKVIFISQQGYDYYIRNFKNIESELTKYFICRLGTKQQITVQKYMRNYPFILVSCSNVIPVKRVNLIIEGLSLVQNCNIKWIHFGDGYDMEKLENQAYELLHSKQNIQYNFKGYISNSDILDFYSKETPDCFIMTSESEGSPVAMQEAISFGMPVIATDVGGISEMIDGNGYLLKSNPSPKDIANSIEMLYNLTDDDYMFMRKRSLEIWEKDYDSEKNVNIFINILKNL